MGDGSLYFKPTSSLSRSLPTKSSSPKNKFAFNCMMREVWKLFSSFFDKVAKYSHRKSSASWETSSHPILVTLKAVYSKRLPSSLHEGVCDDGQIFLHSSEKTSSWRIARTQPSIRDSLSKDFQCFQRVQTIFALLILEWQEITSFKCRHIDDMDIRQMPIKFVKFNLATDVEGVDVRYGCDFSY